MRKPCWSYDDDNWDGLCAAGKEQSPLDLTIASPTSSLAPLAFAYQSSSVSLENSAHTLRINILTAGNCLTFKGKSYELTQFHFHHHSEHLVEGVAFPLELHLVHSDRAGATAVVGIFFQEEEGHDNHTIAPIWQQIPAFTSATAGDKQVLEQRIDLCSLLPDDFSAWVYQGSLTTPPCTEGVEWIILRKAMSISPAQLRLFKQHYQRNCRPIQTLGSRTVFYLPQSK